MNNRRGEYRTGAIDLKAVDRQRQALELRKAGKTFADIAVQLGYASTGGAHKAVMRALRGLIQEPAEEVRKLELERLDALWDATWPAALRGIPKAVEVCLKIMTRRAKYLGLDAPSQYEHLLKSEAQRVAEQTGMSYETVWEQVHDIMAGRI